jgi:hypothetical protein
LGRANEAVRVLEESLDLPELTGFIPGKTASGIALELLAHGDSANAEKMFARAALLYQQRLPDQRRTRDWLDYVAVLLYSRKNAEAEAVMKRACPEIKSVECISGAAITKAALGHRDEALELSESIMKTDSTPRRRMGQQNFALATFLAFVGERSRAVEALQRGYTHGWIHHVADHRFYFFRSLRDDPAFRQLIKPKG